MRLDKYLFDYGYYPSREKASIAIKKGLVLLNGSKCLKASYDYTNEEITIKEELCPYVSFGGFKLERAIKEFNLDLNGKTILDIGSSTGGFTDCALKHGAKYAVCVDVGSNQLHESLRNKDNIEVHENTNIMDFIPSVDIDLLVMDVSFVSIKKIIPYLVRYIKDDVYLICLIKPQFEVGNSHMKNGVVKDPKVHLEVIKDIIGFINSIGLFVNNLTYSTQKGKTGNVEYLIKVSSNSSIVKYDIKDVVLKSHSM